VKQVEASFKLLPPETPEFDHYTPAAHLARHPTLLDGDSAEIKKTLDCAEMILQAVNARLKQT
jgi:hypothetical protein